MNPVFAIHVKDDEIDCFVVREFSNTEIHIDLTLAEARVKKKWCEEYLAGPNTKYTICKIEEIE